MRPKRRYKLDHHAGEVSHGRMTPAQAAASQTFAQVFSATQNPRIPVEIRLDARRLLAEIACEIGRFDFVILREVAVYGQTFKSLAESLYGPASAPERRALSSRTRFDVLRRDNFTCRYCGRRAPDVVLHCDHVVPHIDGGGDDAENLVTSCEGCNYGKSDVPPVAEARRRRRQKAVESQRALPGYLGRRYRDALIVVEVIIRGEMIAAAVENCAAA